MAEPVNLGSLEPFDDAKSIDLHEARKLLRGRAGRASIEVVRRWMNPKRGCRPRGPSGPLLVLPAVKVSGGWRTMASWVERFERERQQQGMSAARPVVHQRTPRQATAAHRRAVEYLRKEGMGEPPPV